MEVIYALCDPQTSEVRYVGKTTDPERRLREHMEPGQLVFSTYKNNWIKNLGCAPEMRILQEVESSEVNAAEIDWIAQLGVLGYRLTNGTRGGTGGAITCLDAKARIRAAHLGKVTSAATRKKMSDSHKARRGPKDGARRSRIAIKAGNKPPVPLKGEANVSARFMDEEVREIRNLVANGVTRKEVAQRFATSVAYVSYVVTGEVRLDAGGPLQARRVKQLLSDEQVVEIRLLASRGVSQTEVARSFKVDPSTVNKLVMGRTRNLKKEAVTSP